MRHSLRITLGVIVFFWSGAVSQGALAQTGVLSGERTGRIESNESPYRVGNLSVPPGETLTIASGVEWLVDDQSRIVVNGRMVIERGAVTMSIIGDWGSDALISVGPRGTLDVEALRLEASGDGPWIDHQSDRQIRLGSVRVESARLGAFVSGQGGGDVRLDSVSVLRSGFSRMFLDLPNAHMTARWTLIADVSTSQGFIRARRVTLAHVTMTSIQAAEARALIEADRLTVANSIVWPGEAYVGFDPGVTFAPFLLTHSILEGGWATFLGSSAIEKDDEHVIQNVGSEAPVFIHAGSTPFALRSGSPGSDAADSRSGTLDMDGSGSDVGAFGGRSRRSTKAISFGITTAVVEQGDVISRGSYPSRGVGAYLSYERALTSVIRGRITASGYTGSTAIEAFGARSAFSHEYSQLGLEFDVFALGQSGSIMYQAGLRSGVYKPLVNYDFASDAGNPVTAEQPSAYISPKVLVGLRLSLSRHLAISVEGAVPVVARFTRRIEYNRSLEISTNTGPNVGAFRATVPNISLGLSYWL